MASPIHGFCEEHYKMLLKYMKRWEAFFLQRCKFPKSNITNQKNFKSVSRSHLGILTSPF
jgi:hypothetical protein